MKQSKTPVSGGFVSSLRSLVLAGMFALLIILPGCGNDDAIETAPADTTMMQDPAYMDMDTMATDTLGMDAMGIDTTAY